MSRMMPRVLMAAMVVGCSARRIRVAQHDSESPIDRREHEPCWNERAQAEHRENERCRPVASPTGSDTICAASHHTHDHAPRARGDQVGLPCTAIDRRSAEVSDIIQAAVRHRFAAAADSRRPARCRRQIALASRSATPRRGRWYIVARDLGTKPRLSVSDAKRWHDRPRIGGSTSGYPVHRAQGCRV
jgi:hypothetical protein